MDLQAAQQFKEKRGILSRLTVAFCLVLTAALLIGSLVSPGRATPKDFRAASPSATTALPH